MNWKELFEILERLICYTYGTIDCFNGLGETINFPAKKDNTIFVYDNIVKIILNMKGWVVYDKINNKIYLKFTIN